MARDRIDKMLPIFLLLGQPFHESVGVCRQFLYGTCQTWCSCCFQVLLAAEHVTVTKATLADWEELQDIAADAFRAFGVPSQVLDFAARLPIP